MNKTSQLNFLEDKIYESAEDLRKKVNALQHQGKTIVFTNGCFDILHRGHVEYLCRARDLGDHLILGLNSDESVHGLKGEGRPVQTLEDRIRILAGLFCLDFLVPFSESTPENLLSILKPDIHTKGGDYKPEALPEASIVESYGGKVIILPFLEGRSSSSIIKRSQRPG
ncbi:MAG: D-glycero-beta-D-manno-heptose 1-phosphate adenylyltransferase [Leptospiraceae bacterium]